MKCAACGNNDAGETGRCAVCEAVVNARPEGAAPRTARMYRPAVVLVVIALAVLGLAYYRFFLPDGIAAVVNGEEISVSSLDETVKRFQSAVEEQYGPTAFSGDRGALELRKLRSQVLSGMIRDRLLLLEARKAGIVPSDREVDEAVELMQARWGLSGKAFDALVEQRFGGMRSFRRQVAEQVAIDRLLSDHVALAIVDPAARQTAIARWLRELQGRATVRVALAEQWSASGCGCCAERQSPAGSTGAAGQPQAVVASSGDRTAGTGNGRLGAAEDAARAYWRDTRGDTAVDAKARDFGCHFEIDIIKSGRVITSLRYQNGSISEP